MGKHRKTPNRPLWNRFYVWVNFRRNIIAATSLGIVTVLGVTTAATVPHDALYGEAKLTKDKAEQFNNTLFPEVESYYRHICAPVENLYATQLALLTGTNDGEKKEAQAAIDTVMDTFSRTPAPQKVASLASGEYTNYYTIAGDYLKKLHKLNGEFKTTSDEDKYTDSFGQIVKLTGDTVQKLTIPSERTVQELRKPSHPCSRLVQPAREGKSAVVIGLYETLASFQENTKTIYDELTAVSHGQYSSQEEADAALTQLVQNAQKVAEENMRLWGSWKKKHSKLPKEVLLGVPDKNMSTIQLVDSMLAQIADVWGTTAVDGDSVSKAALKASKLYTRLMHETVWRNPLTKDETALLKKKNNPLVADVSQNK